MNQFILKGDGLQEQLSTPYMYKLFKRYQQETINCSLQFISQVEIGTPAPMNFVIEAAYNIRAYQACAQLLAKLRHNPRLQKHEPTAQDVESMRRLIRNIRVRLREQTSGDFDFKALSRQMTETSFPRIEASDYCSPKIHCVGPELPREFERSRFIDGTFNCFTPVNTESGYYAQPGALPAALRSHEEPLAAPKFRARDAILAGEVVYVEKALAVSYEREYGDALDDLLEQLGQTVQPFHNMWRRCLRQSLFASSPHIQKLLRYPYDRVEESIWPTYCYMAQDQKFQLRDLEEGRCGSYCIFSLDTQCFESGCQNNCSISFLGDLMVIVACRDIQKGETIRVNRFSPLQGLLKKRKFEETRLSFCDCFGCKRLSAERLRQLRLHETLVLRRIKDALERQEAGTFAREETASLCYAVEEFEASVCLGPTYRVPCLLVYAYLVQLLLATEQPFLGRQFCAKALETFGFSLDCIAAGRFDQTVECAFKGERYPPAGPHENLLHFCAQLVKLDRLIVDRGLDGSSGAKYTGEAAAVQAFMRHWARLLLGWEGAVQRYE